MSDVTKGGDAAQPLPTAALTAQQQMAGAPLSPTHQPTNSVTSIQGVADVEHRPTHKLTPAALAAGAPSIPPTHQPTKAMTPMVVSADVEHRPTHQPMPATRAAGAPPLPKRQPKKRAKAIDIAADVEHRPTDESTAIDLTAGAPSIPPTHQPKIQSKARSTVADVEHRPQNAMTPRVGSAGASLSSKRQPTAHTISATETADVEHRPTLDPIAMPTAAGAPLSPTHQPIPLAKSTNASADVEPLPTARTTATRHVAEAHLSSKHQPNRDAKPTENTADVEHRPTEHAKAIDIPAGAPSSSTRQPNRLVIARAIAADVEHRPNLGSKAIYAAAGAPSLPTRQPNRLPMPSNDAADVGNQVDQRFVDPLVVIIRKLWRRRQSWHRAEKSLTLAASAICRQYVGVQGKIDKAGLKRASELLEQIEAGTDTSEATLAVMPILRARAQIRPEREAIEKTLENLAKQLAIADVVKSTFGFGFLSLAAIVGEAGAVGEYRTVQALWKRFGLAVIETPDGESERQRCKADPVLAQLHAYNPARRSVMFNIGGGLVGAQGVGPRPLVGEDISLRDDLSLWKKMFIDRLRYEAERDPTHRRPDVEKKGEMKESYSKHAANRARRYVEKQFLKFLWQQWRMSK